MSKEENCNKLTCWEPVYKCLNQTPKLPPNTAQIKVDLYGQTFPLNTTDLFTAEQAAVMNLEIKEIEVDEPISDLARSGFSLYKYFAPVRNQLLDVVITTSTTIKNALLEKSVIVQNDEILRPVVVSTTPIRSTPTITTFPPIGGSTNIRGFYTRLVIPDAVVPQRGAILDQKAFGSPASI